MWNFNAFIYICLDESGPAFLLLGAIVGRKSETFLVDAWGHVWIIDGLLLKAAPAETYYSLF